MNGRPATSNSDFGMRSVTGRIRVARPPARMATGNVTSPDAFDIRISLHQHLGAFKVHVKADFGETCLAHHMTQPHFLLGVEHQEAAAPGPDQLAPDGTGIDPKIVPLIDP